MSGPMIMQDNILKLAYIEITKEITPIVFIQHRFTDCKTNPYLKRFCEIKAILKNLQEIFLLKIRVKCVKKIFQCLLVVSRK